MRSQHGGSRQDGSEAHRPHLSLQVFSVLSCVSCDLLFPMHLAFPAPWLYNRRACRGGRETCCRGEHENAVLEPDMDPSPHGPALSRGTHNSGGAGPAFYLPPVSRVGCAVHTIFPSLPRESVIPESCAFGPEQETGIQIRLTADERRYGKPRREEGDEGVKPTHFTFSCGACSDRLR